MACGHPHYHHGPCARIRKWWGNVKKGWKCASRSEKNVNFAGIANEAMRVVDARTADIVGLTGHCQCFRYEHLSQ